MGIRKRFINIFLIAMIAVLHLTGISADAREPVVIVLDPGHGGENLGAEYESYTEKEMNMVVARAMKEELEKYDDVVVYLTHESTEDDLTLEERVQFAKEKKADFLFCLHFNMSVNHNLFGAEVWVSAFDKYYSQGYAFAEIEMKMLTDLGLYSRGIKTKLNDKGDNYYGILRHSTNNGIPAVLIEHCHLDQSNDQPFYTQGNQQLEEFGRLNATAAAKYFRLHSASLGVDYSDYPVSDIPVPSNPVKPDMTEPEVSILELDAVDGAAGEVTMTVTAQDYDSYILYYSYSLDGGNSYSDLQRFPKDETAVTFTAAVPFDREMELRVKAYNGFDVWTESNMIPLAAINDPNAEKAADEADLAAAGKENTQDTANDMAGTTVSDGKNSSFEEISQSEEAERLKTPRDAKSFDVYSILLVAIISLMVLCIAILFSRLLMLKKKPTYHRKRKKQGGSYASMVTKNYRGDSDARSGDR